MSETDPVLSNIFVEDQDSTDGSHENKKKIGIKFHLENYMLYLHTKTEGNTKLLALLIGSTVLSSLLLLIIVLVSTSVYQDETAMCHSDDCLSESLHMIETMNKAVDPCQDFYQYSCGRFEEHVAPGYFAYNVNDQLSYENMKFIFRFLSSHEYGSKNSFHYKMRKIYNTCMKEAKTRSAPKDFYHMVNQSIGWALFNNLKVNSNFFTHFINFTRNHQVNILFQLNYNMKLGTVDIRPPEFLTTNGAIYYDVYSTNRTRKIYKELMVKAFEQLKIDNNVGHFNSCSVFCHPDVIADGILNTEKAIVDFWASYEYTYSKPELLYIATVEEKCPLIPWMKLSRALFGSTLISKESSIRVPHREMLQKLCGFLGNSSLNSISDYLLWHVLKRYLFAMGPLYRVIDEQIKALSMRKGFLDRRTECFMIIDWGMPLALRNTMLKQYIEHSTAASFKKFYDELNITLRGSFEGMNSEDKSKLLDILKNVTIINGVSKYLESDSLIDEYYKDLIVSSSSYDNILHLDAFKANKMKSHIQLLLKENIKYEDIHFSQYLESSRIYATNDWSKNIMLFVPFGALQEPLYGPKLPHYLNMAGIGVKVVTQLTEALFSDITNNYKTTWLTDRSIVESYVKCLVDSFESMNSHPAVNKDIIGDQYSVKFKAKYYKTDILTRNLAFSIAEKEMLNAVKEDTLVLPGTEFDTPQKSFYIALARSQCEFVDPLYGTGYYLGAGNTRMPAASVVNHFVLKSEHFRKTFNCPAFSESSTETCNMI